MARIDWKAYGIEIGTNRASGQVKVLCPQCTPTRTNKSDRSLSCNLATGEFMCHHCDWHGVAVVLTDAEKKEWLQNQPWYNPSPIRHEKKTYKKPEPKNAKAVSDRALKWFEGRGISAATVAAMKITEGLEFMPQKGREFNTVQFNYYKNETLVNTKFRTGDKCFKLVQGAELLPYNIDAIKDTKECIITEGEMDALSFYECGRTDVVSVPNGANANLSYLDDYLADYFDNKETIYIASDSDTKGVQLRDELLRRFGEERCKVVEYGEGCKDANEHLQKYGRNSLLDCLKNAKGFNIEGVFTVSDFEQSLDALWVNGMQKGVTIGHKYFDDLISFETKRLCVVTGIPGSGKSEFIDEITERLNIRYGWRFAYFSPENSPLSYHASKLVEKFTGKHFSKQTLPFNEYQQAKAKLESDFFFILPDEFKIDTILEKAKLLVRKNGIKSLVIDPYNRLENEQGMLSETQYISALLDKLQNFAVRNDVLVILMVHPTKMKTTDGVIAIPTLYDCSGSANFYNKCDFGIVVHRDKEKKVVEVRVDKVKFKWLGETGKAFFKYDINNGRYVSIHDSEDTAYTYDSTNHLQKANYERLKANGEAATLDFPDLPEDCAMPANTAFDDIKPTDNVPF
jgi:twinkle protein